MSYIYIIGKTPRPDETGNLTSIHHILNYRKISEVFSQTQFEIRSPYWEEKLDSLSAQEFTDELENRIFNSRGVITVLDGEGGSSGIESVYAAILEKPQALVVPEGKKASRLYTALPHIIGTYTFNQLQNLKNDMLEKIKG